MIRGISGPACEDMLPAAGATRYAVARAAISDQVGCFHAGEDGFVKVKEGLHEGPTLMWGRYIYQHTILHAWRILEAEGAREASPTSILTAPRWSCTVNKTHPTLSHAPTDQVIPRSHIQHCISCRLFASSLLTRPDTLALPASSFPPQGRPLSIYLPQLRVNLPESAPLTTLYVLMTSSSMPKGQSRTTF